MFSQSLPSRTDGLLEILIEAMSTEFPGAVRVMISRWIFFSSDYVVEAG